MPVSHLIRSIRERSEENPQACAFIWRRRDVVFTKTNLQFYEDICKDAAFFCNVSRVEGKVVAFSGINSYGFFRESFALLMAGATVALIDPSLSSKDIQRAIDIIRPDYFLCDRQEKAFVDVTDISEALLYDDDGLDEPYCGNVCTSEREGRVIFYTSGTTSFPKAVLINQSCIECNIAAILPYFYLEQGWKAYIPVPYCHTYGFTTSMAMLMAGCTVATGSSRTLKKDIAAFRPEILVAVPSIINHLLEECMFDSSGIRNIMTAAGICSENLEKGVRRLGIGIQNHYGSSELPFGIAMSRPEGPVNVLIPQSHVEITIASDGEILLSSPGLFQEYYRMPEATASALSDGVFHTGDTGTLDYDGNLHLSGRKKDHLILENGEKIFCPGLDEILQSISGVADAAVILKDNLLSAVILPEKDSAISGIEAAIASYNLSQPASRKIQQIIWRKCPFPRTSTGKLKRNLL